MGTIVLEVSHAYNAAHGSSTLRAAFKKTILRKERRNIFLNPQSICGIHTWSSMCFDFCGYMDMLNVYLLRWWP